MNPTFSAPRDWTRVHPISPFLGGWAVLGLLFAYLIHQQLPGLVMPQDDTFEFFDQFPLIGLIVAAVLGFIAALAFSYWGWMRTEYRIGDDAVYLRQGIVTRQQRQARLDRLQAVDVVQPLLARIFGFAQINVQVAGGGEAGVELKYLRLGDAEALRNEIVMLAAGAQRASDDAPLETAGERPAGERPAGDGTPGEETAGATPASSPRGVSAHLQDRAAAFARPEEVLLGTERTATAIAAAEEREVYRVPVGRLVGSLLRSGTSIVLALLPVAVVILVVVFRVDVWAAAVAFVSGSLFAAIAAFTALFGFYWARLNGAFNFTAGIAADGLRLRHGLTETRRQTVPPGRVQAIRLHQPWLWRRKDWWRITINVAGYGAEGAATESVLHPVATREEALLAVWLVLPDLGDPDPTGTLGRAMSGQGGEGGFLTSPESARRLDPLQWRFRGVRATERALLIRRGRFERELFVVPHERTQSLGLTQGPLRRVLGLANVEVHSTQGTVVPVAAHLAVADAIALLDAQAERARESRRRQTPEQWLRKVTADA